MKKHIILALLLPFSLAGCGGGGSGGASTSPDNSSRIGYVVDDYVIGGTVTVFQGNTDTVMYVTTTGDKGLFTWPTSLSGAVRVVVSGGKEDVDGSSLTTADQKPFTGEMVSIVVADKRTTPIIINAVTTGLSLSSGRDVTLFEILKKGLPSDVLDAFFTNINDPQIDKKLEAIKAIQRAIGVGSIISELADDGSINGSSGITPESIASPIARATSPSTDPIFAIKDLALQYCIAVELGKEPTSITSADLQSLTELGCVGRRVLTVQGIENLTNLEAVYLGENEISDAAPLRTLSKLYFIDLSDNNITTLSDLNSGAFDNVALMIDRNCIADTIALTDTPKLQIQSYLNGSSKQFPGCVKNEADIRRLVAKVSSTGKYVVTYMTTPNSLANCQIDWGDGVLDPAQCDGIVHIVQHDYVTVPANPVKFLVNGEIRGSRSFPSVPIVVTDLQPRTGAVGALQTFSITGSNLPTTDHLDIIFNGCANIQFVSQAATQHKFTCTPDTSGTLTAVIRMLPGSTPLGSFPVDVIGAPAAAFSDYFDGTSSVDTSKWVIDGTSPSLIGPVSISGGLAQFGAWGRISTNGKVAFSGSKIVIEARMAGTGGSRDTSILLRDVSDPNNIVYSGDTNYCGWGMHVSGSGIFELSSGALECGGSNKVRHVGVSTNQFMEYRWTIQGNQITIERGATLASISDSMAATLGQSIVGHSFYLSIGTASPSYSPGTWDWVRVTTQ